MAQILAVILGWAAAAFVAYPLLRPKPRRRPVAAPDAEYDQLLAEKETVYATLKELEFDQQIGKLTPEDYEDLRRVYQDRAIEVLAAMDALEAPSTLDAVVEEAVAAARARRQPTDSPKFCSQCGGRLPSGARFCPQCGAQVGGEAP